MGTIGSVYKETQFIGPHETDRIPTVSIHMIHFTLRGIGI